MVKGGNVGHRCGVCHKSSDAKVRLTKMRNIKILVCGLEFVFLCVCTLGQVLLVGLYRCFFLAILCCLNYGFIPVLVTPLQGVNGEIFPQRYGGSSLFCNASSIIEGG